MSKDDKNKQDQVKSIDKEGSIPVKDTYTKEELGYYYQDVVPQIVILDSHGQKALDVKGQVDYEVIDDALREIFDLLPRSESIELKRLS